MKKSFFNFVVDQWTTVPAVEVADLSGKTVVVVGANVGIGFEAAKHFARMNPAKLIIACRSENKGKAALEAIQTTTRFERCELLTVDLGDFDSVKRFAERFNQAYDRLDIVVMNAGVVMMEFEETINGWETTLQVNHLATSLMSLLLLPRLVDTGKKYGTTSRLVLVSSEVHHWAVVSDDVKDSSSPLEKLNSSEYRELGRMRERYSLSKLLNVFFVRGLQDRLQSITPFTVNAVNPGYCYSSLRRNLKGWFLNTIFYIQEMLLAWTAEQGSRQLVYAAVAEQNDEDHMKGAFVSKAAAVEPSDFVISEEGKKMEDNLWRETVEILTKEAPELKSIIAEYLI